MTSIQEVTWPFAGYARAWHRDWAANGNWYDATVAFALLPAAALVVWRWWRRRSVLMAAALPFALLVPFMTSQVLNVAINSLRVFGPALTFVAVDWLLTARPPAIRAEETLAASVAGDA